MSFNIVVLGAGAIGCYIGGHLQSVGHKVTFIGRQHLKTDADKLGFTLKDYTGFELLIKNVVVHTDLSNVPQPDYILVCTNSKDTQVAAEQIRDCDLIKPTTVVSLQNGMQNGAILRKVLPDYNVIEGSINFGVAWEDNCVFTRAHPSKICLGRDALNHATRLAKSLSKSGLMSYAIMDMRSLLFSKLVISSFHNPVSSLSCSSYAVYFQDHLMRAVVMEITKEAFKVAKAHGLTFSKYSVPNLNLLALLNFFPDPLLSIILPRGVNTEYISTMHTDLVKKRKTEIDTLNGVIVKMAHEHNIKTPVNDCIIELIKKHESEGTIPNYTSEELYRLVLKKDPPKIYPGTIGVIVAGSLLSLLTIYGLTSWATKVFGPSPAPARNTHYY